MQLGHHRKRKIAAISTSAPRPKPVIEKEHDSRPDTLDQAARHSEPSSEEIVLTC